MEIQRGMVVWSPTDRKLGRVADVFEGVFVVEGGPYERFVAREDRVRELYPDRLVLDFSPSSGRA